LHTALAPSAQREKRAQQPSAAHWQSRLSTNTEWQSVRASQASFVVATAQGAGQGIAIQALKTGSPAAAQPTNELLPLQPGQELTRQSVRVLHDASSSTEHGAGQAISAHIGPGSWTGS
jgi:predicted Abi (CAAX) family protease